MSSSINSISIIGLGLIGGSIAKAVKSAEPGITIKAFDKEEILNKAFEEKTIDGKLDSIDDSTNSDIIFLCLPTEKSLEVFEQLSPKLVEKTILTDVCGVKGIFEEKWQGLKSNGKYVGGHPMTGKEKGGYENSDPLLFENAVYILSEPKEKFPGFDDFVSLVKSLGARVRFLDAHTHDKIIARVSHLPQILAVSLVNATGESNEDLNYLDFAAGGFRDMTRIASGSFDIWDSVLKLNKSEIIDALENVKSSISEIESFLKDGNIKSIEDKFDKARVRRDEIPKNTKGFLNPLFEIYIYVKDEPGVLSKLTTALYENSLNIKDLELLKIREGTGGMFRISFETEEETHKAKEVIEKSGFTTK